MPPNQQVVLACDKSTKFLVVYKCVNQVSSYSAFHMNPVSTAAFVNSIHLRSNTSCFLENMCRRVQPLHDTSSHLSFPTTSSNNMTTMGRDNDMAYFTASQTALDALAFDSFRHVFTDFSVNNRNYTAVLHGIENRWEALSSLEQMDSLRFSRNSAFPPLKSASSYAKKDKEVVCQNQLYENSFSLNTQRQTDTSLVETSKDLLSHILEFAHVDISLNNMCVDWEWTLRHNLSFPEKVHILLHHEVMREKHRYNVEAFQRNCSAIQLMKYDDSFKRNLYGIGRSKRNNPEMINLFPHIPACLKVVVIERWKREGKLSCVGKASEQQASPMTPAVHLPESVQRWSSGDIVTLTRHVIDKLV